MKNLRLLDLFCCAGGAGVGYSRAGFDVTGIDVIRHARNPHAVIEFDALKVCPEWIAENFDAVHASPPCQGYSAMRNAPNAKGAPKLIAEVRSLLEKTGLPWVIENVEAARSEMNEPLKLCGTMFGLGVQGHDLHRHRLFESNFPIRHLNCNHSSRPVVGVYGGHARNRSARHGGRGTKDQWLGGHKVAASEAMGIDWMTLSEMSEAIPPAYTEYVGAQLKVWLIGRDEKYKRLKDVA